MINFYVIQIRDLKTMTIEDVPKLWRKKVKEKLKKYHQEHLLMKYDEKSEEEKKELLRQIEIARQTVKNAERTYDINVEKYRSGNLTGMELKNQQTQLTDAKNSLTDAIISYKLKLLDLKIQTLWDYQNNRSYLPVDLLK